MNAMRSFHWMPGFIAGEPVLPRHTDLESLPNSGNLHGFYSPRDKLIPKPEKKCLKLALEFQSTRFIWGVTQQSPRKLTPG